MRGTDHQAITSAAATTGTDRIRTERRRTIRKCSGRSTRPSTKHGRNCSTRCMFRSLPTLGVTEASAAMAREIGSGQRTIFCQIGVVSRQTNSAHRNQEIGGVQRAEVALRGPR
ncbi:hypothetical protein STENM327S_09350 [Streptomyces tendae]